jgi:acyl carrier protein
MATKQEKTRALIAQKLNLDESEITPAKSLTNDLGADSLDVVEVAMMLEREFNVKFEESETEKIQTVNDLYELIEKHTKK